jgi:surfactin synthase thioesterase subunit
VTWRRTLLELVLPAIRSDYKAIETYRFRETPRLECPSFAFAGEEDPEVIDRVRRRMTALLIAARTG